MTWRGLMVTFILLAFFPPGGYAGLNGKSEEDPLANLEKAIKQEPQNIKYGNDYRLRCVAQKEYQRAIDFFSQLVKTTDLPEPRLQLAMAYVDKIPYASGPAKLIGQGMLSTNSIRELTTLLEKDPNSWPALYGRGMNYLHWPKALNRTPDAIRDFKRLLETQNAQGKTAKPYFALTYVVLGDAYVKNAQFNEARDIWKTGLELFPGHADLQKRLALLENEKLSQFIDQERGLDAHINTDLSIFLK